MSEEIQRKFLTGKAKVLHTVAFPCRMPNQDGFDFPKNKAYGEFWIIGGDSFTIAREGPGKVRNRYVQMVQLTIWVPEGKGTKPATDAADVFKTLFQSKQGRDEIGQFYRFGTIQSFTPSTKEGWTVAVYRIPYTRDVVEAISPTSTL